MTKYFLYNDKQYVDKNVRSCYHEQSRAEQSRAEQSRAEQIVCSFFLSTIVY